MSTRTLSGRSSSEGSPATQLSSTRQAGTVLSISIETEARVHEWRLQGTEVWDCNLPIHNVEVLVVRSRHEHQARDAHCPLLSCAPYTLSTHPSSSLQWQAQCPSTRATVYLERLQHCAGPSSKMRVCMAGWMMQAFQVGALRAPLPSTASLLGTRKYPPCLPLRGINDATAVGRIIALAAGGNIMTRSKTALFENCVAFFHRSTTSALESSDCSDNEVP
ncbi:hypothetical protein BAUCODRAFT_122948 [Baudoinia panamericana UAMH 10762]|uniref:Uncharacterized protein n=1 Tax=Baudoinia panamericana (strain UAMH 10762) TaxID=717646 RepID=M2N975_BAUPA|nr:uncharacterized protein BAUCODRAFT_122948 [Baudoinia panamericana UAMH 10762]EMC95644.1 hypothetical protein BAUCODRAFT_122948 [Baudoinia panamericana UAMH 10762]